MELLRDLDRKLWRVAVVATLFMLTIMIAAPLQHEKNPEVRKAIYGDKPFGLPWIAVHSTVSVIVLLPMPLCIISSLRTLKAGAGLGVEYKWELFSTLFRSWRAIAAVPELRGLYWGVALTWGWYISLFVGWIVLTSILGV